MAIIKKLAYTGWPSTRIIPEKKEVQIHARYITPAMQQLCWKVGRVGCLVIVVWILYKFRGLWEYTYRPPPLGSIFWILFIKITPYLGGWIVFYKYGLPFLLRTKVSVVFNHYLIKVKPPWGLWKKFPRSEGHVFNITPSGQYAESFEFRFAHGLDYIVFPEIHGAITANKLNVRLNDIGDKMNVWFPDEWEGASAQVLDFSDLDRADWPMTEKEKARWPLKEFLWVVVCGIFAGTGFVYLLFYSSSLLNEILGHWDFINPPRNIDSWLGDAKYFWPAFVGANFLVLYAVIARGVFDLFKVLRFATRSERVPGFYQGWRLEKGGYFRLILGLIHWVIAFFIAVPLFYTLAPDPLNYIFKPCDPGSNWPCFRLLLIELKGMIPGVVLGGLGGLGIVYLANLNKAVLDFPWKLRFGKRELGFRDFLFSFYDIDREEIS